MPFGAGYSTDSNSSDFYCRMGVAYPTVRVVFRSRSPTSLDRLACSWR